MRAPLIAVVSFTSIALVGLVDFLTGTEITLALFYLIPVVVCSSRIGRDVGIAAAVVCSLTGLASDAFVGRNLPVVLWNTAARGAIFVLVAFLIGELKSSQIRLRKNEEDLKNAFEELKRSHRELEQFAGSASHDLQEPLRKIVAFGERIDVEHSALTGPEKEYLEKMKRAAVRMQRLIQDLLQLSRVSSQKFTFEDVDLNEVIDEVKQDLELRITEAGGRLQVEPLPRVRANRLQMRQLFLNLLSNALKYRKKSVPPRIVVSAVLRGEYEEIRVQDNGIGFDEKDTERIFRPFDRLHSRTEYEGTGLGIPICQKIVEKHGGKLSARGVRGEGATFTVLLPCAGTDPSRTSLQSLDRPEGVFSEGEERER